MINNSLAKSLSLPDLLSIGSLATVLIAGTGISYADTQSLTSNLTVANPTSKAPFPITPVFAIIRNFTAYTGPFPYMTNTFYVGASGSYNARLVSPSVSNGFYILRGTFSPSTGTPSTPLSNFIVFSQQLTNTSIPNITLDAGQQYSYLAIFSSGNSLVTFTLDGPGCISFVTNTCSVGFSSISHRGIQLTTRNTMLASFDRISTHLHVHRFSTEDAKGGGAGDEDKVNGFWFKPFGGGLTQSAKNGFSGYDGSSWGLAGGYDYDFSDELTAGAAFSYTKNDISYTDQQSGDTNSFDSYEISIYGTHAIGPGYVEAIAAWSRQTYETKRLIFFTNQADGHFDGDQWGVRLGGGLPLAVFDDTIVTPIVRLDWNHITQHSYSETGAGALNLSVDDASSDRLRSSLGAQLDHNTNLLGVAVQPFLRAFWHYDFFNSGVSSNITLAGSSTSFITPGQKLDHNTGTVGAGINFFTHENFTASVAYDYNVGNGYQSHSAQAQLKLDF